MTRLPINLLLYVAILGLLGGSGWNFYQAVVVERKTPEQAKKDQTDNHDRFVKVLGRGAELAGKIAVGPNYADPKAFWDAMREANFNGKEPPPPAVEVDPSAQPQTPVEVPQTPLEDIFVLVLVCDAGPDSRIVIRYKPGVNVEPPADLVAPPGARGDAVAGGPALPRAPQFPTAGDGLGAVQHLGLEDTLWKPYAHIRLVRVLPGHAVFVREDPKIAKEEWKEEPLFPEALELPQDVLKKLAEGLGIAASPAEVRSETEPAGPVQASGWQSIEDTTEVAANRFNIGTKDRALFQNNSDRVFNEDVGTADWSSSKGTMRGVRITKLSPGYERYGVREGEIIIALNGEPVRSKTDAIRIGKALYKRGVRTFEVEFLTPTGQRITRSYVAPDRD